MTSEAAVVFSTGALSESVNESRIPVFTQLSLSELLGGSVVRQQRLKATSGPGATLEWAFI